MKKEYLGKIVVVIISEDRGETQTAKGKVTDIFGDNRFEIVDQWGNPSTWNEDNIKGVKILRDVQ